jgi:hypothetical protein
MNRLLIVFALALLSAPALAQRTPFADVSPCHWASGAVGGIAGTPDVDVDRARTSAYLAENALRQVFEGLQCGDLGWSAGFMHSTPAGTVSQGALERYVLEVRSLSLDGDRGGIAFALTTWIDGVVAVREADAELIFEGRSWKVAYASLADLELPLFP